MTASFNPGMEQDFIDMIGPLNKLIVGCRAARTFALIGDKAALQGAIADMRELHEKIGDVIDCCADTMDTFTERAAA